MVNDISIIIIVIMDIVSSMICYCRDNELVVCSGVWFWWWNYYIRVVFYVVCNLFCV